LNKNLFHPDFHQIFGDAQNPRQKIVHDEVENCFYNVKQPFHIGLSFSSFNSFFFPF